MSMWSRIANVFRSDRLSREIEEELQSHIDEAIEQGRDPGQTRKAFGSLLQRREESRDIKIIPWLESLRSDCIFGWRQLRKNKVASVAAILSLALAIGSCAAAFRIVDALLLRPLPIGSPETLYKAARQGIGFDGKPAQSDDWAYPAFQRMRAAVHDRAELVAISELRSMDLTYGSDEETESAKVQYVSGWMFTNFRLRPAAGHFFGPEQDAIPRAHPVAVLSYNYWTSRFARDPSIIGRTFHMYGQAYEVIGVVEPPFVGTEPGAFTAIFLPTMMNSAVLRDDQTWIRVFVQVYPGNNPESIRQKLAATSRAFEEERAKTFAGMSAKSIAEFLDQRVVLVPAPAGASTMQTDYRPSLKVLALVVTLVLWITCANVANLTTAQAAARITEMALRVSIGAGRWRLIQLILIENALLALSATGLAGVFAWWSTSFIVGKINPPSNPAHLLLTVDSRLVGFGLLLTVLVIILLSIAPALHVSSVRPAGALRRTAGSRSRNRMTRGLIALQVAFCFVVLFDAALFAATFNRLSNRAIGFSPERLVVLYTVSARPQSPDVWDQVTERLSRFPGVERASLAGWALLTRNSWNGFLSFNGTPPSPVLAYFLAVSSGWRETMKIPLIAGRELSETDTSPGTAIVNEAFVRQFLDAHNPLGQTFQKGDSRYEIVGVVADAPYQRMRDPVPPTVYVSTHSVNGNGAAVPIDHSAIIVRTAGADPLALVPTLRQEIKQAGFGFRVTDVETQQAIDDAQTVRERLLATVGVFFAVVAVLLAGVGLYGVLHYSVMQRRREIGIRIALGARFLNVGREVTGGVMVAVWAGAIAGMAAALVSAQYIDVLLYMVHPAEPALLAIPLFTIVAVTVLASIPPWIHAVRIDPSVMLRSE